MRLIRNTLLALLLLPGLAFGSDLSNYVEIGNWTSLNNTTEVGNATEIGPFAGGGIVLGPELIIDQEFDGTGWWGTFSGAVIEGGYLKLPDTSAYAFKSGVVTIGKNYQVTVNINQITPNIRINIGGATYDVSETGVSTFSLAATSNTNILIIPSGAGSPSGWVDSISVKEIVE